MRPCWCGNTDLKPFGPDYGRCESCGTLVLLDQRVGSSPAVMNDEDDFYGKNYWLEHQQADFGYDDFHKRSREDLHGRNLFWLRTLLKYKHPPARTLELGCAHASFVALLQQAGFDSTGVEMSPWVVAFGQETFGVPVKVGPVENIGLEPGSLDVIALMDVLEHLPDPLGTMRYCLSLLKPDGFLLIQTPEFKPEMDFDQLVSSRGPFLEQLKRDEHLYLFSQGSVSRLFKELGAGALVFETALYGHYDMYLCVGRSSLTPLSGPVTPEEILLARPSGRFVASLLAMDENTSSLRAEMSELMTYKAEADRQVADLSLQCTEISSRLNETNAQYQRLLQEVDEYRRNAESQIHELTQIVMSTRDELTQREAQLSQPLVRYADRISSALKGSKDHSP